MIPDPAKICFGLDEELDRTSLAIFLQLGGDKTFAKLFSSRLSSDEILNYVDEFTRLLRKHLSANEYHQIFLQDTNHHHHHHKE
jgi:hypothetical protein